MDQLERGKNVLLAVTLSVALMQLLRLYAHSYLLDRPFRVGLLGQVAIALWICMALWDGKEWARIIGGIYFVVAGLLGLAASVIVFPTWSPALRAVVAVQVLLAAGIAGTLAISPSLQAYMASRRSAQE